MIALILSEEEEEAQCTQLKAKFACFRRAVVEHGTVSMTALFATVRSRTGRMRTINLSFKKFYLL